VPGVADPLPSPNVAPRTGAAGVTDNRTTSYATACRYDLGLKVRDDDMGTSTFVTDSAVVIVVGDETIIRTAGYWTQQYGSKPQISSSLRFCYLQMVDHLSAVFGNTNPLLVANNQNASVTNALNILDANKAKTMKQKFDRQLLAAWLAIANGSIGYDQMVDTDGNGTLDKKMGQWLNELEAARNGTPSDANLKLWAGQLENLLR
ncbi:MAG TPA: hypothetical protein VL916_15415, partial [Ilumatobacteraceae bacterium]|nr:hypothetical protein [Ilumatobacteraceae bacterium]